MCHGERERAPGSHFLHFNDLKKLQHNWRLPRSRIRVHRFMRRTWEKKTEEIVEKNLKLYLVNKCILEENRKLRNKALVLRQENLALLSEFQKKFSHQSPNPSFEPK